MPSRNVDFLLIGGGLASHAAATIIRSAAAPSSLLMVGDEPHPPYQRPPLTKAFLRGAMSEQELLLDPESAAGGNRTDMLCGVRVTGMDTAAREAHLDNGERVAFRKALIATGGRPAQLHVPGSELRGIHYLRTIEDAKAIRALMQPGIAVVVIGAGFIGMELAATMTSMGAAVTVVDQAPQIWPRFVPPRLASYFQSYCERRGVAFRLGDAVSEMTGEGGRVTAVRTRKGAHLPCDAVCVGIGIVPNVELGVEAGLAVENGILVNEHQQTSHPDICAAGDVCNYCDPLFGVRRRVEHWGHAEYTGQLAGLHMIGTAMPYDLLTYVWSDLFELHIEFAGNEEGCDQTILRGELADRPFVVLYLREGRLRAYLAVNTREDQFPPLQQLIRRRIDLAGRHARIEDTSFDLRRLLK